MPDLTLIKVADGLFKPATEQDADKCRKVKIGSGIHAEWKRKRNIGHHKKYFALLNLGYDAWEPKGEYKGQPMQKNFDRFRHDIAIMCGFYDVVPCINGEPKAIAKSISFANMSQDEFDELYNKTVNVLLQRVLKNYSRSDVDHVIEQLLRF